MDKRVWLTKYLPQLAGNGQNYQDSLWNMKNTFFKRQKKQNRSLFKHFLAQYICIYNCSLQKLVSVSQHFGWFIIPRKMQLWAGLQSRLKSNRIRPSKKTDPGSTGKKDRIRIRLTRKPNLILTNKILNMYRWINM